MLSYTQKYKLHNYQQIHIFPLNIFKIKKKNVIISFILICVMTNKIPLLCNFVDFLRYTVQ